MNKKQKIKVISKNFTPSQFFLCVITNIECYSEYLLYFRYHLKRILPLIPDKYFTNYQPKLDSHINSHIDNTIVLGVTLQGFVIFTAYCIYKTILLFIVL